MNESDLFDRIVYKKQARDRLKNSWTAPVLVTLVCCILMMGLNIKSFIDSFNDASFNFVHNGHNFDFSFNSDIKSNDVDWFNMVVSIVSIFITGIIEIASYRFYLMMVNSKDIKFNDFIDGLELWAKGILETLLEGLLVSLWSLLFVVPGIIKAIAYSQALFILSENPEVSIPDSLRMSQKMMKGYKADYFMMQLSFIGWIILCPLTCGIGYLWLFPYIGVSNAYAYKFLKKNAIERNRIKPQELNGED